MPLTPGQCTGELATKAVVEYIDRSLDLAFCNLTENPGFNPDHFLHLVVDIPGIFYMERFAELITKIYTDCGWDVTSSYDNKWIMQFRARISG